ncbi:MAG: acetate--CoA ligase family protein [Rhodospirillales bacterium]|jgi:acetyltransferase|nr:acetate--CoA ligase family protein [Rhodospirillales bacterium]MBT4005783.1 acetate--CoA ligase family protein [Rhodospirillales bacterium]MBT5076537.1 acetate--CoA ligase family protein [Rhodospirillales bacterium]MBT5114068.1 acetate--CoA ligase family protein [Rhodospirillales bacterium]MBT5672596.1 acetate--CoA ligase family protein [Rhodospirillales bacterium]
MSKRIKTKPVSDENVDALFNPKNVVLIGASDRAGSWTARVWRNLSRYGFKGPVYPVNPGREEIWDVACFKDVQSLPETPDHLVIVVPAKFVPGVLRDGARAGARSATIFTSGFDEAGTDESRKLGAELREAIAESGMAVSGPNCLGNIGAAHSLVTMPDDRAQTVARGPIAIVGQSGGLAMAMKRTLEDRGADTGYLVTSGNETGLTTADYIRFFTRDSDTKIIVCYMEAIHDREGFLGACREAKAAGKPVVVIKLGTSEDGRGAAMAHTGALAGAIEAFDAVAGAAGAIRVGTLDDVVEVVEYFLHAKLPKGTGLGAVTFSGGLRGLLLDGAERNGLKFSELSSPSQSTLEGMMGAGSAVGNPLDGGFAVLTNQDTYLKAIDLMLADPGVDLLILQEELLRNPGAERKENNLRKVEALAAKAQKPIVYVSMISYGLNDYSRTLRRDLPHLPFLHEVDKAMRALKSVITYASTPELPVTARKPTKEQLAAISEVQAIAAGATEPVALSEPASKALLSAYGIAVPPEHIVDSSDGAVSAANKIGFPVVLKAVSAKLPHKTEAGAVILDLASEDAVKAAYDTIFKNVEKAAPGLALDGILVGRQITGGLETALGISNDPEVGPIVMFGSGGVGLELYGDVAFSAPQLDAALADALISKTKAGTLIDGFRGQPAYDRTSLRQALMGLGSMAQDLMDVVEGVDVNPFVVLPGSGGGFALDGLIIIRPIKG